MQPDSKQWLGKHVPAANTPQQQRGRVFYVVFAATVAMQWFRKHASTIEAVFLAWSLPRSYLEDNWHYSSVEDLVVECQPASNGS
jgi:hypothetical protein